MVSAVKDLVVLAVIDRHTFEVISTTSQTSSIKCIQKLTEESLHKCAVRQC